MKKYNLNNLEDFFAYMKEEEKKDEEFRNGLRRDEVRQIRPGIYRKYCTKCDEFIDSEPYPEVGNPNIRNIDFLLWEEDWEMTIYYFQQEHEWRHDDYVTIDLVDNHKTLTIKGHNFSLDLSSKSSLECLKLFSLILAFTDFYCVDKSDYPHYYWSHAKLFKRGKIKKDLLIKYLKEYKKLIKKDNTTSIINCFLDDEG